MSALDVLMKLLGEPTQDEFELREGEQLRFESRANHTQNRRRAVGGKLFVTDRRLGFVPHSFDNSLRGKHVDLDLTSIDAVTTEPNRRSLRGVLGGPLDALFGGGLRTRLRVETTGGEAELFVIDDVESVVEILEDARRQRAAGN